MSNVSLNKYLSRCHRELLKRCTVCGNCVANCQINQYSALKSANPVKLVEAIRGYIESGKYDQAAYDFAFQCINCLECTVHCPEGIEASVMPVLAKARFVREGYDAPPMFKMAQPCQRFSYQNILNALQAKPEEKWWVEDVPERVEPRDVVLFLGCHDMIFPAAMKATRDILVHMGVDFASVGGGKNLCCGAVHLNTGEPAQAHNMGERLIEAFNRFQPRTVVFTCPTCTYVIRKTLLRRTASCANYVHLAAFLAERLDMVAFTQSVNGRMTIQDPCFTGRGLGDYESPRTVLSATGGVKLVEMKHNREHALCCGVTALGNNPRQVADTFIRNRLREACDAGADTVVNVCAGCQLAFFPYEREMGLTVRMFSEVVAEAMGIDLQPDKMKVFRDMGTPVLILDSVRETVEAGDYSPDEIAAVLPLLFQQGGQQI